MKERDAALKYFHKYIAGAGLPGKKEVEKFLRLHDFVHPDRSWRSIKDFVRNQKKRISSSIYS